MENGFAVFREKLRGWWKNPDGETLCPNCWGSYLTQFPEQDEENRPIRQWIQEGSSSEPKWLQDITKEGKKEASKILKHIGFKTFDGWFALCEKCGRSVHVPFSSDETY